MSGLSKNKKANKVELGHDYQDKMFVEVYATEANPYRETGEIIRKHKDVAKRLIDKGWASEEPIEEHIYVDSSEISEKGGAK